jgi:hypothetical protein
LAYWSTMKMEVVCSFETSVDLHRTTQRYITEDSTLRSHRCENLMSNSSVHFAGLLGSEFLSFFFSRCSHLFQNETSRYIFQLRLNFCFNLYIIVPYKHKKIQRPFYTLFIPWEVWIAQSI